MKTVPLFSIIIPTFNSETVIARAIQSIVSQTCSNFEIIVQDGNSVDNTREIVTHFNDDRISFLSEVDHGIFDAMNKGIARSSGQWLLFLGSDDALYDDCVLERVLNVAIKHPSTKFIYGDVLTSANSIQRYNDYNYFKLLKMCICHQSIYYHRSLFSNLSYDLNYKVCGDWDFNLKVFRARNKPVYIGYPLAYFSLGGTSNNWRVHPEYIEHFSNTSRAILRYRSPWYLSYYCVRRYSLRIRALLARVLPRFSENQHAN